MGDVAALSDFVAGRVQVMFGATTFVGLMKDGRELLARESIDPQAMTPAELGSYMRSQLDVWGKAIREAGIQPD